MTATNLDNWMGIIPDTKQDELPGGTKDGLKSNEEFEVEVPTTHTAAKAYEKVLAYVGASYKRDAIDKRIVNEVKRGTARNKGSKGSKNGLIDTQTDAEGYIEYKSEAKPVDSNNDGIPDEWATLYLPTDKTYRDIDPETGYSYLELYINSLVDHIMQAGVQDAEYSPSLNDFGLKGTAK